MPLMKGYRYLILSRINSFPHKSLTTKAYRLVWESTDWSTFCEAVISRNVW